MKESRQQRRARERAEANAARRARPRPAQPLPTPVPASAPSRRPHVLEVELSRFYFPDDEEEPVSWSAEWGLRDDQVGTEDSNEDVHQLINDILEDARQWTDRYDLTIEWTLSGDSPRGKTVQDMLTELGVTLPDTVTPGSGPA
jgi:hypothetical protein